MRRSCAAAPASKDDPALSEKYEHVKCEFIGEGNKAFAELTDNQKDAMSHRGIALRALSEMLAERMSGQ